MHALLAEWELWQEAQGLSERTIHERTSTLRNLIEHTGADPRALQPVDIARFCARPSLSGATKATYHASIRAFCKWMVFMDYRTDNPADKTLTPKRPKSKPRPITDEQLDQLLAHANRRRTRTYILFAALAGLRVHEIAKLRGQDFRGDRLTVVGKGHSTWTIPLHPRLIEEAQTYPAKGYWFPAYQSQTDAPHVRSHAVSKAIHDCMLRAGFEGTPHQLRHWHATALLREGVDLRVVQTLLRHESPATTAIYTKVDFDRQVDAITRLSVAA